MVQKMMGVVFTTFLSIQTTNSRKLFNQFFVLSIKLAKSFGENHSPPVKKQHIMTAVNLTIKLAITGALIVNALAH